MRGRRERREVYGFTLIELIIAIVVVGVLSAVALVGIAGLTENASTHACETSKSGAIAASAGYYAKANAYPSNWDQMFTTDVYERPENVTVNATNPKELDGKGWTLTIGAGGAAPSTFRCDLVH